MKAEWRFVSVISGVLYVMTPGGVLMLLWYVNSWATPQKVGIIVLGNS